MQYSLLSINLTFALLKPIWAVCTFPHVTSISEQPEEHLHHHSQTQSRYWLDLPAEKAFTIKTVAEHISNYLPYLLSPGCFRPRWNSRTSADESWWPWTAETEPHKSGAIGSISSPVMVRKLLRVEQKNVVMNLNTHTRAPGTAGSELGGVASAPKSMNFTFPIHFIMFISFDWCKD